MLNRQYRFDCLDDGDLPEARGDDDGEDEEEEGDLTNDIADTTKEIQENIAKELGKTRKRPEVQEPHSPLKHREPRVNKRKEVPLPKVGQKDPKKSRDNQVLVKKNSDMFPVDVRPETFRNNDMFDALTFDKASIFVHEHRMLQAKLKLKERSKNSQEKADDKLKEVQVPSGVDDAKNNLNKEARNLRPTGTCPGCAGGLEHSRRHLAEDIPRVAGCPDCAESDFQDGDVQSLCEQDRLEWG